MIKNLPYEIYAAKAAALMPKNGFMTTCFEGKQNTMAIGWGSAGFIWYKPVFIAMVRHSRFTKELVEKSGEFTVTLPFGESQEIKDALNFCGTKSGRSFDNPDKIAAASLSVKPGEVVKTPVINVPGLHLECKVVYKQAMDPAGLCPAIQEKAYTHGAKANDWHVMYYGEIVAAYETE
jgi:flavin reductase (DIM6/NTAB) family NADH-FMN oxidoreductase RutF